MLARQILFALPYMIVHFLSVLRSCKYFFRLPFVPFFSDKCPHLVNDINNRVFSNLLQITVMVFSCFLIFLFPESFVRKNKRSFVILNNKTLSGFRGGGYGALLLSTPCSCISLSEKKSLCFEELCVLPGELEAFSRNLGSPS
jgi:hypothetical protein